jgi:hypothetical protein
MIYIVIGAELNYLQLREITVCHVAHQILLMLQLTLLEHC